MHDNVNSFAFAFFSLSLFWVSWFYLFFCRWVVWSVGRPNDSCLSAIAGSIVHKRQKLNNGSFAWFRYIWHLHTRFVAFQNYVVACWHEETTSFFCPLDMCIYYLYVFLAVVEHILPSIFAQLAWPPSCSLLSVELHKKRKIINFEHIFAETGSGPIQFNCQWIRSNLWSEWWFVEVVVYICMKSPSPVDCTCRRLLLFPFQHQTLMHST